MYKSAQVAQWSRSRSIANYFNGVQAIAKLLQMSYGCTL
ncbi:hypothetical protein GXM_08345 [Nostoc sphaeroides CCNUC1]|uniref:Uncharacterized protein n=1 Tax=Nostoc sphaeroides CCNUC1 TaxID=2653204 RepID=A0A5P8WE48_9NOSO|nr:hypothetical protein GXM_08345 [Nostoc sphaeroides CCNUC1]